MVKMSPFPPQEIKKAAQALSERYRKGEKPFLRSVVDRHAYLKTRLPATQAALTKVMQELWGAQILSYLDIGAGPGGSWEILDKFFPTLQQATFVEIDLEFVKLGKVRVGVKPVQWLKEIDERPHDLVLFSYSWGEIHHMATLQKAWDLCQKFLVIVEPGTPRGYQAMLDARDYLIQKGAEVVAPCPHTKLCPLKGGPDWCHFGVRLERSKEHQRLKEGSLGFEDEKFSYIVLSKEKVKPFYGRMIKDSLRRKGHTVLTLCSNEGIQTKTVSKKNNNYKSINKLNWGDKLIDNI